MTGVSYFALFLVVAGYNMQVSTRPHTIAVPLTGPRPLLLVPGSERMFVIQLSELLQWDGSLLLVRYVIYAHL